MLTGVEAEIAYIDDIIVVGRSKEDLLERIGKVLIHIQDFGFQLRPEKCNFYLRIVCLFLTIHPYHLSLLVGLLDSILCQHRADIFNFLLFGPHRGYHMLVSIRERHLLVLICFSSSAHHVLFVLLGLFVRWEASSRTATVLWSVTSRILSKQHIAFLGSSHLAFSQCILSASTWRIHIAILTQKLLEKKPFYRYHLSRLRT